MARTSKFTQHLCSNHFLHEMYQLIGGELSPYTSKVRLYLRYKRIPFEPVQATAEIYANFIKPKVGWSVIPVLVTPGNEVFQDSCDIVSMLEARHPEPSILPSTPKQKIVSVLLEMFCDEWMVLPIMHYRWSYPENLSFLCEEFGRVAFPKESHSARSELAGLMYNKFKNMLPALGITKRTGPEIEKSWEAMLDDLTLHFDKYPFFLGGKPCIGDFSMAGMTYAHLFRDPHSGYVMKTKAPLVCAWVESMNGHLLHANRLLLHHVDDEGNIVRDVLPEGATDFCADDEIPATLLPILHRFFEEFSPVLLSTKQHVTNFIQKNVSLENNKLPRSVGDHEFTLGDVTETRKIFTFQLWKWQHVTDIYCSLTPSQRKEVDQFVEQFPHGLEIVQADLSACRVARTNNIVHVDINKAKL